ncbi:hypothetical protein RQP53_20150 [Paucibacter sp. APW11]|uniref:Lipoprotein n=1 Tax=Roseateles aquae TaxID=3077235 RepID=A0ABU3PG75_9BURK|nr:hypothetical protein [Paucibacter sp. APW11]MDT9001600.1 hypothetical protein [Paucibacter sp. APW11]
MRTTRSLMALSSCAALVACGGGGGGSTAELPPTPAPLVLQAPPSQAASLAQSSGDAIDSVKALGSAATDLARRSNDPSSAFLPFGNPWGHSFTRPTGTSPNAHALAVQEVKCADLPPSTGMRCTGSITVDSNVDNNASSLPAGSYIKMSFNNLVGSVGSEAFSLNGSMRMDFLTAVSNPQLLSPNTRLQLSFDKLSGSANGESIGPITAIALFEIDAQGQLSMTFNGSQYFGMQGVSAADSSNFRISSSRVRTAHWADSKSYVDYGFSNWQVSTGKPLLNSSGSLSAGADSVTIRVLSSSSSVVVYDVLLAKGGVSKHYTVTANYSGSNVSYSAN